MLLATSPLLGCAKSARNTSADSKEQEDLVKDDDQEKQGKTVPYSKRGEYTVTLQQDDFIQEGEDEATGAQAPDDKDQAVEPAEPTAEKKDLTVADVKLEDVKVYYQVLVNRAEVEADESGDAEPQYETREAQTKALSNYDGALTLSFADSDAASNATDTYYVVIDALMSYVPVNVDIPQPMLTTESSVASDSESADVTIKAQDATFAPGISASDITLGGSFEGMGVVGAEAAGDALTVHLSGTPKMDYEVASTYTAGRSPSPDLASRTRQGAQPLTCTSTFPRKPSTWAAKRPWPLRRQRATWTT